MTREKDGEGIWLLLGILAMALCLGAAVDNVWVGVISFLILAKIVSGTKWR